MKDHGFYDKIDNKLDFVLRSKYIPRIETVVEDLLDKISWGLRWKKFTNEEAEPLLDKLEYIQKNKVF